MEEGTDRFKEENSLTQESLRPGARGSEYITNQMHLQRKLLNSRNVCF